MSIDGIMFQNIGRYMACLLQVCMFMCVVTLLIFPQTAVGTIPRAEHMKDICAFGDGAVPKPLSKADSMYGYE